MKKLDFPEGSFVLWCDEYYKVISNFNDHSGIVIDMGGDIARSFYFEFQGGKAQLITDKNKIIELENHLKNKVINIYRFMEVL